MINLGLFKAGALVRYRANFHADGAIADPTDPEAQLETPDGAFTGLTAPAKVNGKDGHFGGTIDTAGFGVGQYVLRMAGTVSGKVTATEFCFKVVAFDPDDAAGLGLSRLDQAVSAPMTLTSAERTAVANEVEAQIIDETDSERVLQAIVDKIAAANPSLEDLTLGAIASAIRTELATELARLDTAVSSRLAATGYTAPDNAGVAALADALAVIAQDTGSTLPELLEAIRAQTDLIPPEAGAVSIGPDERAALAAAVLAAAATTPIAANTRQINSVPLKGHGTSGSPFGAA